MSSPIISVENLGKCYRIHHEKQERYTALRDVIARKVRGIFHPASSIQHQASSDEDFWALKDVSFEVNQGEVVGIIGRNGAGKSTLLKILSRITEPTKGRITLRGRVASLLEVGTGFHPELTGRENIFLNGAILGMTRAEIRSKFDEIVAFAEVEKFLDTAVKHYSSGMYVRLAFAVAAHLEPEILIVDEVLAVGDAEFQKKCLGKMGEVAKGGRTVLFVSHNIGAITALCSHGLYLKSGQVIFAGSTQQTIHAYLSECVQHGFQVQYSESDPSAGNDFVRILSARILGPDGNPQGNITVNDQASIEIEYKVRRTDVVLRVNLHFSSDDGAYAFASIDNTTSQKTMGYHKRRMHIPPNFFNDKIYLISIYVSSFQPDHAHIELKDALVLTVSDDMNSLTRQSYTGRFPGTLRPLLRWEDCQL
jgi:lipopolysaccharide transport system ATP-binding protein